MNQGYDQLNEEVENKQEDSPVNNGKIESTQKKTALLRLKPLLGNLINYEEDSEIEEQEEEKKSDATIKTEENEQEQEDQYDNDNNNADDDDRDEKEGEGREERRQEAAEDKNSKNEELDPLIKILFKPQDKTLSMFRLKTYQKNKDESLSLSMLDERGSSNMSSLSESKIDEAVLQRRGVRYLAYFVYLLIIALVVAINFKLLVINGSFLSNANANLMLKIDNCTLFIKDKPKSSNIRRPVYAIYRLSTDMGLGPVTKVFTNGSSDPQTLHVLNEKDSAYCLIELFVKPNTPIQSLEIKCPHCNITQDTSAQLQIEKDLIISGDVINANFRDIKVRSFSYKAITGHIQLNHVDAATDNNSITITKEGDIVIQSTKNFRIDAASNTQAFCFGGPFIREVTVSNCSFSGQNETSVFRQNIDCHTTYDICNNQDCFAPDTKYLISSANGNIYANIIPAVGSPISTQDANIVKGQIYDDGLSFSSDANDKINHFKELVADESIGNPFIILNLGNIASRSSKYTKWVISSTPSYSLLKPWWIGTFSASVLNGYTETTNGFLLPGFCPFVPQFTNKNLLDVQNLIKERINTHNALVTFVSDESLPLPPSDPEANSGIFPLIPKGNPFDKWFSLQLAPNDEIILEDNNYTQRGEILAAVVVSLLIAAYITYTALEIILFAITRMYFKLVNLSGHLEKYKKRESSKNPLPEPDNLKENKRGKPKTDSGFSPDQKSSFLNFIKFAPSPSAFIDYLALILYGQFSSSVTQFYHLLFKEETSNNTMSLQEIDPQSNMVKGMEIKMLYEKYCFTNHFVEEKLTDPANMLILNKYGYKIVSRKDLPVEVFTKINIKSYDPFMLEENRRQQGLSSLELYIKENVQVTEFEEDQIEISTFTKIYNEFCEYNSLPSVVISPLFLKEKYGIGIKTAPQQFIVKIPTEENFIHDDMSEDEALLHDHESWWIKHIPFFESKSFKKHYSINISKIQHHLDLVMGKTDKMKPDDVSEATRDRILYPKWWIWDAITVLAHLLIGALLTVPLVGLTILNESQYLPWTLKNPTEFATFQDILQDPAQLLANLYNSFSWNIVLMILVTTLWIMTFFDLVLYYAVMEFPQDYSFKKAENASRNIWIKRSKQLEWILFFISVSIYFFYIGLVITWFLLGALINPNAFLPFASAAVTFVTFVVSKYNAFKELSSKGTNAVMKYIDEIFGSFINKVTKKLSLNIEKTRVQFEQERTKELTGVKVLKNAINDLIELRILDPTTIPEYTQKLEALEASSMTSEGEIKDLSGMIKESEAVIGSLKATVFAKIKEKYQNQLPSDLIELTTSVLSGDEAQIKQSLMVMKESLAKNLEIHPKLLEIFYDLLFPSNTDQHQNLKNKMFDYILIDKSIPKDSLIEVLDLSGYLESEIGYFVYFLKKILRKKLEKNPALSSYYTSIIDIAGLVSNNKLDYEDSKSFFIDLTNDAEVMSSSDKNAIVNFPGFIKFLQVLLDKKFEDDRCRRLGANFLASVGLEKEKLNRATSGADSILGYLRFAIPLIKHGPTLLEEYAIKGIFQAEIMSASEFHMFCLKLAGLIHQKRQSIYSEAENYFRMGTMGWELRNLIKMTSFYSMDDFEVVFPWPSPLDNPYFTTIAEKLKMSPREILGLIDLIHSKVQSRHINVFLQGMATRMNLKFEDIDLIRCLIDLFLSNDEASLLHALKVLKLDHGHFLLVSKIMMNPLLMTKEEFNAIGVTDENLIKQKSSVYTLSIENFMNWKNEMRKNITESINSLKKARNTLHTKLLEKSNKDTDIISDHKYQELKFLEREAELGHFYLTDFDSFSYSIKNLTEAIEALDNPLNNLREKLLGEAAGVSTKIEYLSKALNVKLFKGRFYYFNDSQQKWVREVAKSLSVEYNDFYHFMRLFFVNKYDYDFHYSLLHFFPKEKIELTDTKNLLHNLSLPLKALENQAYFVSNTFPEALKFPSNPSVDFPALFLKKMIYNDPKIKIPVSELMVLAHLQISNLDVDPEGQEKLLDETYRFALFAKGHLLEGRLLKFLQKRNPVITSLLNILSLTNIDQRQEAIVNIFERKQKKEHPIKVAIVLYGLLTGSNYKVKVPANTMQIDKMSIKEYLGTIFKAYPEAFTLFEVILERNPSKFFQKTLPIFRRIAGSSGINVNLFESLFLLLLGEQFNPYALANKLSISSEYITFFMNLARLRRRASEREREQELKEMKNSVPFNFVLSKLKIKSNEFTNFVRLLYGLFENEESMKEIISTFLTSSRNQNVQEEKKQAPIEMTLFKVIVALNKPTDPFLNMFQNEEVLKSLKKELNSFFELTDLSGNKENAFIISALAAGNFLVLKQYKHLFEWIFPTHDTVAETAILRLTMGLSGLLNPFVSLKWWLIYYTDKFIASFYPKKEPKDFTFEEIEHKQNDYPLPNNTQAYAVYLTFETLDIEPRWIHLFLLYPPAFSNAPDEQSLNKEFILAIMLNFTFMPHVLRDILGLYEWACYCKDFYEEKTRTKIDEYSGPICFVNSINNIYKLFAKKLHFNFGQLKNKVYKISRFIEQDPDLAQVFKDETNFHYKINQSILFIYSKKKTEEEANLIKQSLQNEMTSEPHKFIASILEIHPQKKEEEKNIAIGEFVYNLIKDTYNFVSKATSGKKDEEKKPRYPNSVFTDLCILGAMSFLRLVDSDNMRVKLYNLHQLCINIERKMFFDDVFYKMSKFKLMKLLAISTKLTLRNTFEWCVIGSLFTEDYIFEMEMAQSAPDNEKKKAKEQAKINNCKAFGFGAKDPEDIRVGDLGVHPATFENYISLIENLLKHGDVINMNSELGLYEAYLYNSNDIDELQSKNSEQEHLFEMCKAEKAEKGLLSSKAIIEIAHGATGSKKLKKRRVNYRTGNKTIQEGIEEIQENLEASVVLTPEQIGKLYDLRTGLDFKKLREMADDFEGILTNSYTQLIVGIVQNNDQQMRQGDHIFNKNGQTAEMWSNLNGILSLRKDEKFDSTKLRQYLDRLSRDIKSDIPLLEEILSFLLSGQGTLDETNKMLGITGQVKEFLMNAIQEDESYEGRMLKSKLLNTKLLDLPKEQIEALEILKNIYNFKKNKGWKKAAILLSTKDSKTANEPKVDPKKATDQASTNPNKPNEANVDPNKPSEGNLEQKKANEANVPEYPLVKLIEHINFKKLKEKVTANQGQKILMALGKLSGGDKIDCITEIFIDIIMNLECYKEFKEKETDMVLHHFIVQLLIHRDFPRIFEMLVLSAPSKELVKKKEYKNETLKKLFPQTEIESQKALTIVLRLLGIINNRSNQGSIELFKIFITAANGNLASFSKRKNYKKTIEAICDYMASSKLFSFPKKFNEAQQKRFCQLLLGVLGWDLELCLRSFADQKTLDEGYLLLHLYGCLNIDKLLLQGKKGYRQAKKYLRTLFNFTCKSLLNNEMDKNHFSTETEIMNPEDQFEKAVHRLLRNFHNIEKAKERPKEYNHYILEAFQNSKQEKWQTNTFSFEMMWSICDGTVMAKLLNSLTESGKKRYRKEEKEASEANNFDEKLVKDYTRDLLLNTVKLVIQLTKFYNQDGNAEEARDSVLQNLADLMGLINHHNKDNKKFWDNFMLLALNVKTEESKEDVMKDAMKKSLINMHMVIQNENSFQEDMKFDVMMRLQETVKLIIKEEKDRELILDLVNVTTGKNVRALNRKTGALKTSSQLSDLGIKDRVNLLFTVTQKLLFPENPKSSDHLQKLSELSNKIWQVYKNDVPQSGYKSLVKPAEDIIKLIKSLKADGTDGLESLMILLKGWIYESRGLIKKISKKTDVNSIIDSLVSSYYNAQYVLDNAIEQQKNIVPVKSYQSKTNFDSDEWADIMRKIKEDKAKSTDLFKVLDAEGDKNGRISEDEFRTLANRLGLRLSQHRIKEIFAKVKGSKGDDAGDDTEERDLDEKEFEKALDYLQEKNLIQALQFLGITPEILTAILIRLTILLILIFVFIFLGIKAFALGGTFGSIINSLFPAAGGIVLGRDKDKNDEKIEDDNVKDATDKGFEITTKEEL